MRRARLAIALLALPLSAQALSYDARTVNAELQDKDTGKRVPGALFVMQEQNTVERLTFPLPGGHGSVYPKIHCLRGVSGQATQDGVARLLLPKVEVPAMDKVMSKGRSAKLFAYAPGYCVSEMWAGDKADAAPTTTRDTRPPFDRLRYLKNALASLYECAEPGKQPDADFTPIRNAMRAEIAGLERQLPANMKAGRGFAIVPVARNPRAIEWGVSNGACSPARCGGAAGQAVSSIQAPSVQQQGTPPPAPGLKLVCRDPDNCDLDRRYPHGMTALYQYIDGARYDHVELMLPAGADPNIEDSYGGDTGVDALLKGPLTDPPGPFTDALRTVQALAADGRATISELTARRASQLTQGVTADAATLDRIREIGRIVSAFPVRKPSPRACDDRFSRQKPGQPASENFAAPAPTR